MLRGKTAEVIASTIGIVLLVAVVTTSVAWLSAGSDYFGIAVMCNLVAIVLAVAGWTGAFRGKEVSSAAPKSWADWLGMFIGGLVFTIIFLLMDCGGRLPTFHPEFVCNGHPGLSVVFTIAAAGMTAIALPSAVRAWILEKYQGKHRG